MSLQHTVCLGLHFCLRGVQEQYDLVPEQLTHAPPDVSVYNDLVYYKYTEFVSKNNQHRFKDTNMQNKESKTYVMPGSD